MPGPGKKARKSCGTKRKCVTAQEVLDVCNELQTLLESLKEKVSEELMHLQLEEKLLRQRVNQCQAEDDAAAAEAETDATSSQQDDPDHCKNGSAPQHESQAGRHAVDLQPIGSHGHLGSFHHAGASHSLGLGPPGHSDKLDVRDPAVSSAGDMRPTDACLPSDGSAHPVTIPMQPKEAGADPAKLVQPICQPQTSAAAILAAHNAAAYAAQPIPPAPDLTDVDCQTAIEFI
ncbi:hypothetical protein WJX84_004954 [Apatococcus fuscideae]|uniref:Uncharacterized protein n=1 Tax=Apatococcus fuscideae TaxID=2026836 RepID=A0AAW1SUN7_9CHLO